VRGAAEPAAGVSSFRLRLLVAMMLVVVAVTAAGLVLAQRLVAGNVRRDLEREFQGDLAARHAAREARDAALSERCRALSRRPRIHAALEDGAPDLLYPSARDEMIDAMDAADAGNRDGGAYALHARFYRFLDPAGRVLSPPAASDAGQLSAVDEERLALPRLPDRPQTGFLPRSADGADEVIAMPIVSTEDGQVISALVVGFGSPRLVGGPSRGPADGLLVAGRLLLPGAGKGEPALEAALAGAIGAGAGEGNLEARVRGQPCLVFYKSLNPESLYPAAYEVSAFPLAASLARQRSLVWKFAGAGTLLLLGAFGASHWMSTRLSRPVEKLAEDSREQLTQRHRAEEALEATGLELQRAARFSADASHQLKTPVTVLRAGLEELLAGEFVSPEAREEVSTLVHQTFRLASIIEDLLLLSRMDAGRLKIQFSRLDLSALIAACVDDLGAIPDGPDFKVDADYPPDLWISGEKRFTSLILQNLLENARKYNRPGGRIGIAASAEGEWAVLAIGNTGAPIPESARAYIFERFHRGAMGENVPGHGIGLSLARELARLHGGELRLTRSEGDWSEFEVRFRIAAAES
jgi:signal transduction histidine kinase